MNIGNIGEAAIGIFDNIFSAELFENNEYITRKQYQDDLMKIEMDDGEDERDMRI